jgi:hypothetical protein
MSWFDALSEIVVFTAAGFLYVGRVQSAPLFDAAMCKDDDSALVEETKQARLKPLELENAVADALEFLFVRCRAGIARVLQEGNQFLFFFVRQLFQEFFRLAGAVDDKPADLEFIAVQKNFQPTALHNS